MNRKQRNRNRANAQRLAEAAHRAHLLEHVCENCGEPGGHWISTRGPSLMALATGVDDQQGFWTCPKLYGADGRRLPEHTEPLFSMGGLPLLAAVLAAGVK